MNVRRASQGDLDALLGLYRQLSADNAGTERARAEQALSQLNEMAGIHLLVAELDEHVVGTVTLVVVPNLTHNARPWAQVENMVVDESFRGSGAGRMLIEECLRLAESAGCYKVQLQSGNQRRTAENDAHGFYAHLGFAPSSVGFRYYLDRGERDA